MDIRGKRERGLCGVSSAQRETQRERERERERERIVCGRKRERIVCGRKRERGDRRRRRRIEVTSYAHAHSTHKRSLLKNSVRGHAIFPDGHFAVRGEEREENGTGEEELGNRDMTTLCSDSGSSKRCTLDGGKRYIDRYIDRLRREREREQAREGNRKKVGGKEKSFFQCCSNASCSRASRARLFSGST